VPGVARPFHGHAEGFPNGSLPSVGIIIGRTRFAEIGPKRLGATPGTMNEPSTVALIPVTWWMNAGRTALTSGDGSRPWEDHPGIESLPHRACGVANGTPGLWRPLVLPRPGFLFCLHHT